MALLKTYLQKGPLKKKKQIGLQTLNILLYVISSLMGNYSFLLFGITAFFIVFIWSLGTKLSTIFFWNGASFIIREDFFKNYNVFAQKGDIHECGFSGVDEPLKKLEIHFLILSIFFIIYEIEFLLFLPFFINISLLDFTTLLLILVSFLTIMFSYWYEWEYYLLHFVV